MDSRLRILLDRIYELEGLVHLSLHREDCREDFLRLIGTKGNDIAKICSELSLSGGKLKIGEDLSDQSKNENMDSKIMKGSHSTSGGSDDDTSDQHQSFDGDSTGIYQYIENEMIGVDSLNEYSIEENESEDNKPEEDQTSLRESLPERKEDQGKLVFTINDKFRFRKELFNNSDVEFNNTLALVASMENYEEAETYFINDVQLNPADSIVREFLEVVKRYFR